jgi:two-component system cell cycle sensor histidine kinase/response regulator CckA
VPGLKNVELSADWEQWVRLVLAGFGLSIGIFEARRRSVLRIHLLNQAAEQALARAEEANAGRLSMERMMQEAQRRESLGVLAGGIAHDFNNFLTIIRGNVDLLKLGLAPNSEQLDLLSEIDEASARSVDLTQKILVYTGRSNPEVAMLDLVEEVLSSARLMESSVPLGVKLVTELSPTPVPIHGDATLIDQLVINLIQNAYDACRAKGGVVRVVCALETLDAAALAQFGFQEPPSASLYATLLISDNGSGIDNEVLQRVFEPFYSAKLEGHGLGLAVVRGIAETHAAGLRVTSEPNGVTECKLAFPTLGAVAAPLDANVA